MAFPAEKDDGAGRQDAQRGQTVSFLSGRQKQVGKVGIEAL